MLIMIFKFNKKTKTIMEYLGEVKDVDIPEKIDGIPVRVIGDYAFRGKGIERITIPKTVRKIGKEAFAHNLLTYVVIPGNVKEISWRAFMKNSLEFILIEKGVEKIGDSFCWNNKLKSIEIPTSVMRLGSNIVMGNDTLVSVVLPRRFKYNIVKLSDNVKVRFNG